MKIKFPSAYTIIFLLTIIVAALTWVIPAGHYDMVKNEKLNKMVPQAGTYKHVDPSPQGIIQVLRSPVEGFYDTVSNSIRALDIALFVLFVGGFLRIVTETGAIDIGIMRILKRLHGKEIYLIPILMFLFAFGGTTYGMAEETLPFYAILVPVMISAGFDAITGAAIVMIGAGIGCLASTINPFATIIASNASGIDFMQGFYPRLFILIAGWFICVAYTMRYAMKVKKDPSKSLVYHLKASNEKHFIKEKREDNMTTTHSLVLIVFLITFAVMIWGVSTGGWWMPELTTLFFVSTLAVGIIARYKEETFVNTFVDGARDLLGVAFIITLARGLVFVMDSGNMTHTLLNYAEVAFKDVNQVVFINLVFFFESIMSLLVPSSTGLAVLSMPILAPLGDFVNVGRDVVVTAYQSASGFPNLIVPTSGVVMGGLAIARIPYTTWVRFISPLLAMLVILICAVLSYSVI